MQNDDVRPGYYAVLNAEVRYSNISSSAKLLYAEITALCNLSGVCYAKNEYFANLYNVSLRCVQMWLKELQDNNFIEIINDITKHKRYISIKSIINKDQKTFNENANVTIKELMNYFKHHD